MDILYDRMQEFHIIGITDSRELSFSKEVQALIARSHVFSGGKRHHEIVAAMLPESSVWIDITVPLDAVFECYAGYQEIVVLLPVILCFLVLPIR